MWKDEQTPKTMQFFVVAIKNTWTRVSKFHRVTPPQPFENYLQLWRPAFWLENSWLYSWTLLNFPFIPWTSFICKTPLLLMLDLLPVSDCKNLHIWWISASSGGRRGLDATSGIYQNRPQKPSTDVGQRQSKIFSFVLKRLLHRMYNRRNKA